MLLQDIPLDQRVVPKVSPTEAIQHHDTDPYLTLLHRQRLKEQMDGSFGGAVGRTQGEAHAPGQRADDHDLAFRLSQLAQRVLRQRDGTHVVCLHHLAQNFQVFDVFECGMRGYPCSQDKNVKSAELGDCEVHQGPHLLLICGLSDPVVHFMITELSIASCDKFLEGGLVPPRDHHRTVPFRILQRQFIPEAARGTLYQDDTTRLKVVTHGYPLNSRQVSHLFSYQK